MVFDYDETNPLNDSYLADFPANERGHRDAVLNSISVDHDAEGLGEHLKVSLQPLALDPSLSGTAGFLYTKEIATITELFYMDEGGQVTQLTSDNSASPDKLPLAGGTMSGLLTAEAGVTVEASDLTVNDGDILLTGTALAKLANALAVQGRDVGNANWRNLIQVDGSDVCEIGDQSLGGGLRLNAVGIDALVAAYGAGDFKVWHAGHFDKIPVATNAYTSGDQTIVDGAQGSVEHALGIMPGLWTAHMRCTSTNLGYASLDVVPIGHAAAGFTGRDLGVWANATHFGWTVANSNLQFLEKNTSSESNIDYAKWKLVFQAWY